jgi:hypothetical protein
MITRGVPHPENGRKSFRIKWKNNILAVNEKGYFAETAQKNAWTGATGRCRFGEVTGR